ncbi:MAG: hypothetical protein ACLGGX_11990 [Bdellovibrionia bacterium]
MTLGNNSNHDLLKSCHDLIDRATQEQLKGFQTSEFGVDCFSTRDFCLATRGLLVAKKENFVKETLEFLLQNISPQGMIPTYFAADSINNLINKQKGLFSFLNLKRTVGPMKPHWDNYLADSAFDTNLFFIKAFTEYCAHTHDFDFFLKNEDNIKKLYHFYESKLQNGLIEQPAHSGMWWTNQPAGASFLTNLLYCTITTDLSGFSLFSDLKERNLFLKRSVYNAFWNEKDSLFRIFLTSEESLFFDQLLALKWNFLDKDERSFLYGRLILGQGFKLSEKHLWQNSNLSQQQKNLFKDDFQRNATATSALVLLLKYSIVHNDLERSTILYKLLNKVFEINGGLPRYVSSETLKSTTKAGQVCLLSTCLLLETFDLLNKIQKYLK